MKDVVLVDVYIKVVLDLHVTIKTIRVRLDFEICPKSWRGLKFMKYLEHVHWL